jgi:hypothetical protein
MPTRLLYEDDTFEEERQPAPLQRDEIAPTLLFDPDEDDDDDDDEDDDDEDLDAQDEE